MTIRPRVAMRKDMEEMINRGGEPKQVKEKPPVTRFTLTLSRELVNLIDENRARRLDKISRHQWVLEAMVKALERFEEKQRTK